MNTSIDTLIARAILLYLAAQIGTGPTARAFFRLEGFGEATYRELLTYLAAQEGRVAGRPLIVRSIAPIENYPEVAMEPDRSATWYRNHLPAGQSLLLVLNRRTSDAQSLKDVYAVSEQALTRDGIGQLIEASFRGYQLDKKQRQTLVAFVQRLRRLRIEPQLRDLTELLRSVDHSLATNPGMSIEEAVAGALPAIQLFHCRELAAHFNTPRGDKLLRSLKQAAHIGTEMLESSARQKYLDLLAKATLANDTAFGGLSSSDKANLLRRFIDGQLGDNRAELLRVLQIDWNEVQQVISARGRITKSDRYAKLTDRLAKLSMQPEFSNNGDITEVIENLTSGHEPDSEVVERFIVENSNVLDKIFIKDLRAWSGLARVKAPIFWLAWLPQ